MTTLWDVDFDTYATQVEGERAVVSLDLGARWSAPLASHPHRVMVRIRMLEPRPDGWGAPVET
jgi:hypothetical protein